MVSTNPVFSKSDIHCTIKVLEHAFLGVFKPLSARRHIFLSARALVPSVPSCVDLFRPPVFSPGPRHLSTTGSDGSGEEPSPRLKVPKRRSFGSRFLRRLLYVAAAAYVLGVFFKEVPLRFLWRKVEEAIPLTEQEGEEFKQLVQELSQTDRLRRVIDAMVRVPGALTSWANCTQCMQL